MTNLPVRFRRRQARSRGQSLVEFSLVIVPFVFILMGIFDLGRGIYMMNGTAEAAREIARVTSVHSGCPLNAVSCDLGSSSETGDVVQTQRGLMPGLTIDTSSDITCVDISDVVKADNTCRWGVDYVRVRVTSTFTPITPIVGMFGNPTFRVVQPGEVLPVIKERQMDHGPARERQQGQVMVLFLLAIFAIIGMVGLVLDGGSVFAQRRDQQTAADLAAMAGAAAYLNATGTAGPARGLRRKRCHLSRCREWLRRGHERRRHGLQPGARLVLQRGRREPGEAAPQQLRRDHRHADLGGWRNGDRPGDLPGERGAWSDAAHVQRRGVPGSDLQ